MASFSLITTILSFSNTNSHLIWPFQLKGSLGCFVTIPSNLNSNNFKFFCCITFCMGHFSPLLFHYFHLVQYICGIINLSCPLWVTWGFPLTNWNTEQSCDSTGPPIFCHKFPLLDFSVVHNHFSPVWHFLSFFHSYPTGFWSLFYISISDVHHRFTFSPTICLPHYPVLFPPLSIQVTLFQLALSFSMNIPNHTQSFSFPFLKIKHFTLLDTLWTNSVWEQAGSRGTLTHSGWVPVALTGDPRTITTNFCHSQDWRSQSPSSGHLMTK